MSRASGCTRLTLRDSGGGQRNGVVARRATALAVAAMVAILPTSVARADVASTMASELAAAGVPNPTVTVTTPSPATSTDYSAFDLDPVADYPSLSEENLLSPDPTIPMPVATVTFGKPSVTPLPGLISTPGSSSYHSLEDAELPVWRLQVMLALKHRLAAGDQLAGIAMRPQFPNRSNGTEPDLWTTPPDPADYPPAPMSAGMSADDAERILRGGLPAWATSAQVEVAESVANERSAHIEVKLPAAAFELRDPQELSGYALLKQLALNERGAAIGGVTVRVLDPVSGVPLLTYAGDASWGLNFLWVHPLVMHLYERALPPTSDPVSTALDAVPSETGNQDVDAAAAAAKQSAADAQLQAEGQIGGLTGSLGP